VTAEGQLVLIVEDDARTRSLLRSVIRGHGYRSIEADSLAKGIDAAMQARPDLLILDLCLPDGHGIELVARVRQWSSLPIIVLSAHDRPHQKVQALDMGADDYQTKPFDAAELLARVRAALRRTAKGAIQDTSGVFRAGELLVDLVQRRVTMRGLAIRLTPIEYRLLLVLIRHAGSVVTQQRLLAEVWGPQKADRTHYARIYMAALRRKLELDPVRPRYLLTDTGVGYRLISD
jgi:two-component system, OmpR family, KDP operon response regulator KdpE